MARLRAREPPLQASESSSYSLRRRRASSAIEARPLDLLLAKVKECKNIVLFTGSGLSASSGMSTFTCKNGLYERAQKRFKVSDGKKLFCYSFFERQKKEAQAFFAEIYKESQKAAPCRGHEAIEMIEDSGKLVRHYTLNVDGLAAAAGCSTWNASESPDGKTVEMHGSITQIVCTNEDCNLVADIDEQVLKQLTSKQDIPCPQCKDPSMRCRIMLYDDKDGECITPDNIFEVMEEDVEKVDMILWIGISFEQSASTHYFRKVREFLLRAKRWKQCTQAIVNLNEEAHFNLISACNNIDEVELLDIRGSSDDILSAVAKELAVDVVTARPAKKRKSDGSTDISKLSEDSASRALGLATPSLVSSPVNQTQSHGNLQSLAELSCKEEMGSGDLAMPDVTATAQGEAQKLSPMSANDASPCLAPTDSSSPALSGNQAVGNAQPTPHLASEDGILSQDTSIDCKLSPTVEGLQHKASGTKLCQEPHELQDSSAQASSVKLLDSAALVQQHQTQDCKLDSSQSLPVKCAQNTENVLHNLSSITEADKIAETSKSALQALNSAQQGALPAGTPSVPDEQPRT